MKPFLSALLLAVILTVACSSPTTGPDISVEDPWVRASMMPVSMMPMDDSGDDASEEMAGSSPMTGNSAAYMVIKNEGREVDRLVGVGTVEDIAEFVELHRSEMTDGVMTMNQVDGIDIPAGGEATLEPGSFHIMLINLKRKLAEGDTVELVLTFEGSGSLTVAAEVRAP